ncbi:MAG: MATE family efflux transporter [Chitinophagaceae bacterium]
MAMTSTPDFRLQITNRQIISIALPIAAAILVPQINFVTNNIFLGRLGEETLAVAGITGVFYLIFAVVGHGLNNGLQALISRRAGENKIDEISKLFNHGLRLSLCLAVVGIIVTYTIAPWLLRHSIHNLERQNMAIGFLKIRIWGILFLYIYQMRNALLVGTNNSRYLIAGTLAETIMNIALDYLLIYGKFGFPAMGFNGAAVASVIAEATGMIVVFAVIYFKGIGSQLQLSKNFGFEKKTFNLILQQSGPLIFQFVFSIMAWEFFYILIEHHGSLDLAVSNTMRNIFGIFGCGCWAFAATTNTMVSNVIGQGLHDRVDELIKKIMWLSVIFAVGVFILINCFPRLFLSIYGQGDAFVNHAIPVLRIVSTALVGMAVGTVWVNAVIGTGNSRMNLLIEIAAITLYCTYVWYTLEYRNWSITIGWMSEWIYWLTLFSLSFIYMKSGKWKGKVI